MIKLDLQLMQDSPSCEIAEVVHAVNAEAERTGALILAEGIETEEHLRRALALGASYGQGWLFGRPGELRPDHEPGEGEGIFPLRRNAATILPRDRTPFEIVASNLGDDLPDSERRFDFALTHDRDLVTEDAARRPHAASGGAG